MGSSQTDAESKPQGTVLYFQGQHEQMLLSGWDKNHLRQPGQPIIVTGGSLAGFQTSSCPESRTQEPSIFSGPFCPKFLLQRDSPSLLIHRFGIIKHAHGNGQCSYLSIEILAWRAGDVVQHQSSCLARTPPQVPFPAQQVNKQEDKIPSQDAQVKIGGKTPWS